ncbi:MAG: ABC transporter permease [Ilumatobacteraceae bacterium]
MAGRIGRLVGVVFVVSLVSFFLLDFVPGDPIIASLGDNLTQEEYDDARRELGLDRPTPVRYVEWLGGAVTGDFGTSIVTPGLDVGDAVRARLPVTIQIALLAMVISVGLAVPLAMVSAHRAGGAADTALGSVAFAMISIPAFLLGLLLIFFVIFHPGIARWSIVAVGLVIAAGMSVRRVSLFRSGELDSWWRSAAAPLAVVVVAALLAAFMPEFPRRGFSRLTDAGLGPNLRSAFLPALSLALTETAVFMRVLRNDLITVQSEDFVLSARAKGMPAWWVMCRHALRPASLSIITVAGVAFARLLGGTVIVETIFGLPGMGTLVVNAIRTNDYTIVQACIVVLAVSYVVVNAAVDLSYRFLDPRIGASRG